MNDIPEASEPQDAGEPQAGGRLAAARRAGDITVREIAKELHLDEPKVLALEENRFDVLGAPVFAKGHLRKYAELVGVSPDDVLADYYKLNRSSGAPPVVGPKRTHDRDIAIGPWVAAVVVIVIVAGAAWWYFRILPNSAVDIERAATPAPFAADPVAEAPVREVPAEPAAATDESVAVPPTTGEESDAIAADGESVTVPATDTIVAPAAETATDASDIVAAADDTVRLTLIFSGDCWTEVTDATGRRLFFDLGSAGRRVNVRGAPPLRVLLGDSDNAAVEVDGAAYAISAADRRGQTARLTIGGQ